MSAISRKPLNLREFVKTGEVPPADYEEYQVWLFERSVITEKEAFERIAAHRWERRKSTVKRQSHRGPSAQVTPHGFSVEAIGKPLPQKQENAE